MKQIRLLLLMLALLVMGFDTVSAQTRWTGTDVSTLNNGDEVFLYNVGTGRFMIHGGDWGIQGRLFYNDTGKRLKVYKDDQDDQNFYFDTGTATEKQGVARYLICNVPGQSCGNDAGWTNNDGTTATDGTKTYTIIFDGNTSYRNWTFTPVQTNDGTYTYYLNQTYSGNKYWMGAVYGDNWGNHDGDGYGYLISLSSSYDKATWSQLQRFDGNQEKNVHKDRVNNVNNNITPATYSTTMVPIFNADTKVSIDDLYKWRVVTKDQLLATMNQSDIGDGLSTNLTYLINDRGFERNDFSFFNTDDGWVANKFTDVTYTTNREGRYRYTWGYRDGNGETSDRTNNQSGNRNVTGENYMAPVRLKAQFDNKYGDGYEGKIEAKFGYLEFEGVGTVSTYITAPTNGTGVYRISAYGFCQGDHPAYFFATTKNPAELTLADINNPDIVSKSAALKSISDYVKNDKGTYTRTPLTKSGVIGAGYDFVYDKDPYYRELQITVNEGDKIYFGVVKTEATKSSVDATYDRTSFYHDTDWVGADQFDITYLGTGNPVWLDERYTDYLGIDAKGIHDNTEYKSRAVRLHRTFEIGKWNSFVYPMNLSAVQVRAAFGDKTQVAELLGPGNITNNTSIIDFQSIELPAEGGAIEAGHFYIIKPERDMITSTEDDPFEPGKKRSYYSMGNATFTKADLPTSVSVVMCKNDTLNDQVYSHGTYFNNTQIPTGSYVLGKNKEGKYNMYHLTSPATSKGFRGWITDTNATQAAPSKRISINGIFDETTSIDGIPVVNKRSDNNVVYDLTGRKVGSVETMETLSKGIYVVNGKKWIVK